VNGAGQCEVNPGRRSTLAPARIAVLAALAAVATLAPPASAEQADRTKPINFSGDSGNADLQARGGTLVGNVIITQGTLSIRADRIVFKQNADNSLSATAYGNPVAIRQKRDGVDEYYEGYAERVEYDGTRDFVQLFDHALLKRGQDEIRSNYVSYNVSTELFSAEGRPGKEPDPEGPGARVRGTFQPKGELPLPGKKDGKDPGKGAKDSGKGASKGADQAQPKGAAGVLDKNVVLQPAGELAPKGAPK
jgi:lipopolysaccharide export system protein LptA